MCWACPSIKFTVQTSLSSLSFFVRKKEKSFQCDFLAAGSESAETMEVDNEAEGSGEVEVVEVDVQVLTASFEDD